MLKTFLNLPKGQQHKIRLEKHLLGLSPRRIRPRRIHRRTRVPHNRQDHHRPLHHPASPNGRLLPGRRALSLGIRVQRAISRHQHGGHPIGASVRRQRARRPAALRRARGVGKRRRRGRGGSSLGQGVVPVAVLAELRC